MEMHSCRRRKRRAWYVAKNPPKHPAARASSRHPIGPLNGFQDCDLYTSVSNGTTLPAAPVNEPIINPKVKRAPYVVIGENLTLGALHAYQIQYLWSACPMQDRCTIQAFIRPYSKSVKSCDPSSGFPFAIGFVPTLGCFNCTAIGEKFWKKNKYLRWRHVGHANFSFRQKRSGPSFIW